MVSSPLSYLSKGFFFHNAIIRFEQFEKFRFPTSNPLIFNIISKQWQKFRCFRRDFDGDV